jgi:formimidoylglutamate deiminase
MPNATVNHTSGTAQARTLWAAQAWLPSGWAQDVLLRVGNDGRWSEVTPRVKAPPADAHRLHTPLLPGLVNAHSHAFQRAFAGLTERRHRANDDFWSWRERMYRVAQRITPKQLRAIAAQLFVELLQGGYTQVCEFHYLQHANDGSTYSDPHTMAWALAEAAARTGLGLTLMPALYERAGFDQPNLKQEQMRFATSAASVWGQAQAITHAGLPLVRSGLVVHSLRAASAASIHDLCRLAEGFDGPIHVHVAEQMAEVRDCLAATGHRPVAWLARTGLLDKRWHLVHATHTTPSEIDAVARSGAAVVLCPTTEANLGDGLCDLHGWLASGTPLALGSDSHATRDWREELRWLEYGQRLTLQQRNVAANPGLPSAPDPTSDGAAQPATAHRLWQRVQNASAGASGEPIWGLTVGARADALLQTQRDPSLLGIPPSHQLDAMVFSSPGLPWSDVMVAGRWVVQGGQHPQAASIADAFEAAMAEIWADA